MDAPPQSPFAVRNVRLFILFRLFFNSRFYYPVFTILFLDFGLSLEQFALLNVGWAASIVLLEVPSGALADTIGRRNLLVAAGALMIAEMCLLCFVPPGSPSLLFGVFLANRILSGAAEAAASGADEALAYDSLAQAGDAEQWPRVLEVLMRVQSVGFVIALTVGAAVYDPDLMQWVADRMGLSVELTQSVTLRFPLYLCLVLAVLTLGTTLRMEEVMPETASGRKSLSACARSVSAALRTTLKAGHWILHTPSALVVIVAGLVFDSAIRMFLTINSQYYRVIELPEASFGLIGSAMSMLGLLVPTLARRWVETRTPQFNYGVLAGLTFVGLWGLTWTVPWFGLAPVLLLFVSMYLLGFYMSYYLNRVTNPEQRATVLSFKGLSFNLAYGGVGLLYTGLLAGLRPGITDLYPALDGTALEDQVFTSALWWFPWYFLITLAVLAVFAASRRRRVGPLAK